MGRYSPWLTVLTRSARLYFSTRLILFLRCEAELTHACYVKCGLPLAAAVDFAHTDCGRYSIIAVRTVGPSRPVTPFTRSYSINHLYSLQGNHTQMNDQTATDCVAMVSSFLNDSNLTGMTELRWYCRGNKKIKTLHEPSPYHLQVHQQQS